MAIQSNSSEIEVSGGIPLYTGIASVSVVAVNPTLAELLKLGVKLKTEPVYTDVQIGENTYKMLPTTSQPSLKFCASLNTELQNPESSCT